MTIISNSMLLVRRITELQRRRDILLEKQDRLHRTLPEWTFAPLQLAGMSADEIRVMMSDLSDAERDAGIDKLEQEIDQLDQQIDDLENSLLTTPSRTLESVQAVLDLAVRRFRSQTVSDPKDVFYDYGDARVLFFLERAADDLRAMLDNEQRAAG